MSASPSPGYKYNSFFIVETINTLISKMKKRICNATQIELPSFLANSFSLSFICEHTYV